VIFGTSGSWTTFDSKPMYNVIASTIHQLFCCGNGWFRCTGVAIVNTDINRPTNTRSAKSYDTQVHPQRQTCYGPLRTDIRTFGLIPKERFLRHRKMMNIFRIIMLFFFCVGGCGTIMLGSFDTTATDSSGHYAVREGDKFDSIARIEGILTV
jgi:hypothetical protein